MAQTSTTIQPETAHKANITGTVISFTKTGTEYKIASSNTTTTPLGNLAQFDLITVTGTTNNNRTFTVKSATSSQVIVEEEVTTEAAGASFTLDYVGFVTDKNKGDGYYSQVDGVHTVAYHVNSTMTGSIKMQGSLATTPTEDDWFDISGTTFTADQSTLVDSKNFTGNFVWVRAKCTAMTAGSVSKILYNH
jgi:hypothetical protein